MKHVTIYTLDYCPFCKKAKKILRDYNVPFEEIDITQNETAQTAEIKKLYDLEGEVTFPQIIIGDERIGGCSDLEELIEKDEFTNLLKEV